MGCLDSMERGTVEWNSGTVEWNSGMVERWNVERWNGIVEWWNGGIVEWATMTNDLVPHHLFARAQYAAQSQKSEREE